MSDNYWYDRYMELMRENEELIRMREMIENRTEEQREYINASNRIMDSMFSEKAALK